MEGEIVKCPKCGLEDMEVQYTIICQVFRENGRLVPDADFNYRTPDVYIKCDSCGTEITRE